MRINKLALHNFRNHKNNAVELGRLNIFVGRNNSGKSSILSAIEWALTGRNLWTDRAGRGAGDLVTRGEKNCQVGLEIDGLGGVVRAMPPHTLTVGKGRNLQESQAAIYHHLGADEQVVQILLNAGSFINLPPAEQKAFLFALCGISCTAEEIAGATVQYLRRNGTSDEQAREAASRVKSLLPRGFGGDPAILEGMEKRAREQRRESKKDLERTRAALAEMELPNLPDGLDLDDKEAVERQLAELEREKNELLKAHGARRAAQENLARCRDRAEKLAAELERLKSERDGLVREAAGREREELAGELDWVQTQVEQVSTAASDLDRELAGLQAAVRARQAVVEKLQAFDGRCPLAPELIGCRMTGTEVKELINQLLQENNAGAEKIDRLRASLRELQDQKQALQHRAATLEKALAGLENAQTTLRSLDAAIERTQRELDGARQEAATWEETLHKSGADPEEIDRLQGRIDQGREILRRLELAAHGRRQARQMQKDLKAQEEELAVTERMVKALGSDGIRKTLLGDRIAGLTEEINTLLAAFTDERYQITWKDDFTPLVHRDGSALPVKLLSKSEQLRVGIALQAAIARMTGLNFLAVDEVDMLDQDNRDLLTGTLLGMLDRFDQVLLFCTVGDVQPQNPGLPGVKMFWVEDGTVGELGGGRGKPAVERGTAHAAV
jgi:DNA repair exonuclease SbcCD ATPase subunit